LKKKKNFSIKIWRGVRPPAQKGKIKQRNPKGAKGEKRVNFLSEGKGIQL